MLGICLFGLECCSFVVVVYDKFLFVDIIFNFIKLAFLQYNRSILIILLSLEAINTVKQRIEIITVA